MPCLEVNLVCYKDTSEAFHLVLLFYTFVPLFEQLERIGVCYIVDQHHLVGFAQEVKCNFFKDVLASDVNQMQFNRAVCLAFNGHVFHGVLAALGHHVVVVELALAVLVDDLSLPHGGLSCNDYSRSQNRHYV